MAATESEMLDLGKDLKHPLVVLGNDPHELGYRSRPVFQKPAGHCAIGQLMVTLH